MSKGGRYSRKKKKKSGVVKVLVMAVVIMVLVVSGLLGGMVYRTAMERLAGQREEMMAPSRPVTLPTQVTPPTDPTDLTDPTVTETTVPEETTLPYEESGKDIINILLVGQNYRKNEEHYLADTIILATVNKNTKTLTLTSFLRDTWIDLPDYGGMTCYWNRINTAYALGYQAGKTGGAMEMMNMTLKLNFGIEVDHNVEVNFESFETVINMLGGMDIELTEAQAKYMNGYWPWISPEAGVHHFDGHDTLQYARMRHADGSDNDIKRAERQRQLIIDVAKKMMGMSFGELQEMVYEVLPMITTNMTQDEVNTYVWELLPLLPELTMQSESVPIAGTYAGAWKTLYGQQAAVLEIYNMKANKEYMMAITEGIPAE